MSKIYFYERFCPLIHYLQFIPKERLILSLSNRLLQSDFTYIKTHSDLQYDEFINAKKNELVALENNAFNSL